MIFPYANLSVKFGGVLVGNAMSGLSEILHVTFFEDDNL